MTISLPAPIAAYFSIHDKASIAQIARLFSQDAVVFDEGHTHTGHAEIEEWQRAAHAKFEYTVEPLSAHRAGAHWVVNTQVTGNFPGSPAKLDHAFELENDLIKSLKIN